MDKIETFDFDGLTHCPWCGEPDTDGEFCDASCLRAFWADVDSEFGRSDPRASNDRVVSCK